MEPVKLIATYSRVSTARQEEEQTVKTQLATLAEFAQKNGYRIVQEYIDDGWSGDVLARPSLDRLRQDAKSKMWSAVLIYDPDRLARRYSYQELIMDELREAGIEIIFVTISAPKNSEDKILYGVRGLFAEYERTKISERFRLGKIRKVKEGHVLTEAPYGYDYIHKQDNVQGYYVINEAEAQVVRMIFRWVADEAFTQRKVIRRLLEIGIKPRKSKRGVWNSSTLTTMLSHKVYIGETHWGKSYAVVPQKPIKEEKYKKMKKSSRATRPESEWYKIPVPAIIDEDLFNRARLQIQRNAELSPRNKKNQYLLAGKIYCACGRRRAGEGPQHGKHLYYRCNDRVYCFPLPPQCQEKGVNARITDTLVWNKIVEFMSSPKLMLAQAKRSIEGQEKQIGRQIFDDSGLRNELAKLKGQEDRYNKAYGAGVFSIQQLAEYLEPLRDKTASIEKEIARNQAAKQSLVGFIMPTQIEIESYAQESTEVLKDLSFEDKRSIIIQAIEKIVATKTRVTAYGILPVRPHVNIHSNHRNGQSTTSNLESQPHATIPFTFEIDMPNYNTYYQLPSHRKRNKRGRFISKEHKSPI